MPQSLSQINCATTGQGPPVLMIHGNPATHSLWRPLAERVSGVRRVYAIDLPGFGGSPSPAELAGYGLGPLAESILRFTELQGLERFDLVGHSFGGGIAITLASLAPERIRSLIAITPLSDCTPPLAGLLRLPLVEPLLLALWGIAPRGLRHWCARSSSHVSYGTAYNRERANEAAAEAIADRTVATMCRLMSAVDYPAYHNAIARVEAATAMPLLLVGAGNDRVIPYRLFNELRARMPRAACHVFPESGHMPMWQYPDELARIVLEFWDSHDR